MTSNRHQILLFQISAVSPYYILKKLFEFASAMGIVKLAPEEAEGFVRMLLAVYHGMAIQLLSSPERIDDERIWLPIRRMLLLALR